MHPSDVKRGAQKHVDMAIGALWLVVGGLTIISALYIAYLSPQMGAAPFLDQWGYVDPNVYLRDLFGLHNGQHPIVTGRLLFALDYYLFDASNWFLQWVTFACLLVETAAFVLLARLGGVRTAEGMLVVAGFAATMVFNPQQSENLWSSFQVPFVMTFAAAVSAAYAMAAYADARDWRKLALSLLCSAVATVSLGNGVLVPLLMSATALYLRLPRAAAISHLVIALLGALLFLNARADIPAVPLSFAPVAGALHILGSPIGHVPSRLWPTIDALNPHPLSAWLGLGAVIASALFGWTILRTRSRDPAAVALFTLVVFILLTAGITAIGRIGFGNAALQAGRYVTAAAVLFAALGIGLALQRRRVHASRAVLGAGALIALLIPLSALDAPRGSESFHVYSVFTQASLITLADADPQTQRSVTLFPKPSWRASDSLRAHHKWHFRDPWSRTIGQRLAVATTPTCDGEMPSLLRNGPLWQIQGAVEGRAPRKARTILITNANKIIVGYGRVDRVFSDLIGNLAFSPARRQWIGAARVDENVSPPRFELYLASDAAIVCRIASAAPAAAH
jgi:hypothetical protein